VSVVGIVCLFVCLFAVVVGDSVQLVAGLLLLLLPLPCLGVFFVLGGFLDVHGAISFCCSG
jgi:hypothetical protein